MRLQAITPVSARRNQNIYQTNNINRQNIHFCVGEDYGPDLNDPENPNKDKPGFKKGLTGILTVLTFPVSVPAMIAYEHYKDKNKDKKKSNINPDNIED